MRLPALLCRLVPLFLLPMGGGALVLSGTLIAEHVAAVREVKQVTVPLVAQLPELERRVRLVSEQVELSELHTALRVGSHDEQIYQYVLPPEVDVDRLISFIDVLREDFQARGMLSHMSAVEFGDERVVADHVWATPVRVSYTMQTDGLQDYLALLSLAGVLTVADALTPAEQALLFERTESENPAGIVALEKFLATDLLTYARSPETTERQLLKSFSSENFRSAFRDIVNTPLLRDARRLLGGDLGTLVTNHHLWPLPILSIFALGVTPAEAGWYNVDVELLVYRREV